MLTHEVRADLALIRSAVDSVLDTAASASAACGVGVPETQYEATQLLRRTRSLEEHSWHGPRAMAGTRWTRGMLVRTDALRSEAAERQELFAVLLSSLSGIPTELRFRQWRGAALADAAEAPRWERRPVRSGARTCLRTHRPERRSGAIANALDALLEASIHLQTLLGVEHCLDSRTAAESAVAVSEQLLKIGRVPAPWSSVEAVVEIHVRVTATRALRDELVAVDSALAESFGPEIIEQVDDEMLVRYRTDHRSFWRAAKRVFQTRSPSDSRLFQASREAISGGSHYSD